MHDPTNSKRPARSLRRAVVVLVLVLGAIAAGCGEGADESDPFLVGRSLYGDICSACHGRGGQGGVGPDLSTVTEVWPSCTDQIKWISLGSDGWKDEVGDTYGADATPIEGGMPAMSERLTNDEIAMVAAFERTQFGGADREIARADCGVEVGAPAD